MSQHLADNSHTTAEEAEVFVFPASFAQARLWFLDRLFPGNPFYNVSAALTLTGSLNNAALEQTFNEIVRRHEALRTTFRMLEEQLVQVIAPTLTIPLSVGDLRSLPATEQDAEIRRFANEARSHPFDLSSEPLLRVMLLQLDSSEHILLLNLHHIICDGWSIGVLIRELGTLYTAFANNQRSPLPDLPIQYADFAHWQREWLQGEVLETQRRYWKQQLDNLPLLNLPTDYPRPATPTYRGATQFLELPKSLSEQLEALSQRQGVTLFMTLLAAFQTLLYRYTQQEDIVVGSAIANRNRGEIEGLIGFFVNSLVLRTDLSGNPTFVELLKRVREVALGAYAHQDLPFEKLVEELHPERNLSHHPLFQVVFSLQNTPIEALVLPGLSLSPLNFDRPSAKFDLEVHLWESPEGLRGQVIYSSDLWDDTTITRMLGHFQMLLQGIIVNPQQCLYELPILTQAEQHQLLVNFNPNSSPIKSCFHQLFEQQVEQTPDAIALVFEDEQLTYRELNHRSNQLAHYLQKLGVEPEVLVGICLERSVEMIVGLLGIFKAGGAYIPFDPTYPQERLKFMLEDSQVSILLTHSLLAPLFNRSFSEDSWGEQTTCSGQPHQSSVICLDKEANAIQKESQNNAINSVKPDNLAYVIYTSGSTGKPKGVVIEHRGLSNLCQAQIQVFNLQPGSRLLQFASLSFDASIFEIVMAFATGSTLYLAKKESLLPGQNLIHLLRKQAITHVTLPPSVLAVLPESQLPALQTIISAGETCSMDIVKRWTSSRRFFNAYGPTEATVWSTVAELTDEREKPSIGRPITNTQVYILDSHLQPVPIGIPGELYIGGEGVARGYLNQSELTAVAFIANPFVDRRLSSRERLYKTGDLARYQPDGNIEFLGRMDAQVKIRGFRIELGEIEALLKQHPAVKEAVVMAKEDVFGNKRLVTYFVPNQEPLMRVGAQGFAPLLRCFLKEKLPEYMIPSAFVMLEALPYLPNGKVDRHRLKVLDVDKTELTKTYIAPRTPIEEAIAKIWATLLNNEPVGIHDNFFELGGDSLLAVRLMAQIHQQFEREIPLSTLFLNPTIEGLANTLTQQSDSGSWSPLVPIQPSGSQPPFFCIHPILGVVFPYYELAYALGFDQPFYGLQPLGLDGEQAPFTRIEEMAAHYIEALRQVQPSGPYFLGGWSFGGLVAFEMAQQLLRAGHQVALLAIFDTLAPIPGNLPDLGDSLKFMFTAGARYIGSFLLDYFYLITTTTKPRANHSPFLWANINKLLHGLRNHQAWQSILGEAVLANALPQPSRKQILSELNIRPMLRIYQANNQATLSYVPQVYPNSITLLKTSVQSSKAAQDSSLGWSQLAKGRVKIHQVPGNHLTMLRKPHVKVLANQLKVCIEQARIANNKN
ncbi:non-ribosomal peptide synthetase [Allocoleopsis franciscana]|uniref:Amino acid adenylation enzyme/thioester reductase family protein n=1 Tax=Allocoleopsis franciscana PCC 7113 TaxID=1173027 RepID=K9WDW9_9CYAN|nr:non-ribosomal peptide synthetase [Allocoleopsis franciscana]AFZ17959.1 amino acid adenylation enzyme/thioester reductase family protein [Allocoleopsis franciscana PCC 7113]